MSRSAKEPRRTTQKDWLSLYIYGDKRELVKVLFNPVHRQLLGPPLFLIGARQSPRSITVHLELQGRRL